MRLRNTLLVMLMASVAPATAFGAESGPAAQGPEVDRALPEALPDEANEGVIQTPPEQESVVPSYGDTPVTGETDSLGEEGPVQGQQPRFDRDVLPAPELQELPPPEADTGEDVGDIADLVPHGEAPATDSTEADVLPAPEGQWRSEGEVTDETRPDLVPRDKEGEGMPAEPDLVPDRPGLVPDDEKIMPDRPGIPADPDAPPGERSTGEGLPGGVEETESVVPQPGEPEDRRYEVFAFPEPEGEHLWEDTGDKVEGGFDYEGPM